MNEHTDRGAAPDRRQEPSRHQRTGRAPWVGILVLAFGTLALVSCTEESTSTWTNAPLAQASTTVPATPEPAPDAVASDTDDPVAEQSDAERARPLDPPAGNVIPRFVEPERAEGPEAGNVDPAPIEIDPAAVVDATPDDGETTTPTPETAPPAEPTEPAAEPTEPTEPAAEPTEEATVTEITVVAQDTAFDTGELTFEAGATVRLTLENRDPIPHNLAIYRTDAAEDEVFVGETFTGPDASRTYEFTAPAEPGEYFFRCDTHPTLMTGTLIVE